ncbi:cation transport regulator ChaB [Micromonospora fluostatini]|uniref:Cation transport regulator ChaB n=1 Tax=Micromonospora fluostatini TaxID=1629071 RepID=A0ABY2DMJ2_9ACTN|nr:cation transport regulator ChaB [Micromonospora fluostatini]
MPAGRDVPGTLQRSPKKAQDAYAKAHDSAVDSYGESERAHRTAFAAVEHSFDKVGDHREAKGREGPSDRMAASGRRSGRTAGEVDATASKEHLMDLASKLDIRGRSRMNKADLVKAIREANSGSTREARGR